MLSAKRSIFQLFTDLLNYNNMGSNFPVVWIWSLISRPLQLDWLSHFWKGYFVLKSKPLLTPSRKSEVSLCHGTKGW